MIFFATIYIAMAIMTFAFCWTFSDDDDIMTPGFTAALWPVAILVAFVAMLVYVLFQIGCKLAEVARRKHDC